MKIALVMMDLQHYLIYFLNSLKPASTASLNVSELEKLKQELQIRNKLNEQQANKIVQQHEQFNKKQLEVMSLDKRIEDLKTRIAIKRSKLSEQMGNANVGTPHKADFNSILIDNQHQQLFQQQHHSQPPQYQDHQYKQQTQSDARLMNGKPLPIGEQTGMGANNTSSPSKVVVPPKYATKQEIANTYMNKYGSDVMQKYRLLQQQQQQQQQQVVPLTAENSANNQANNDDTSTETSETSTSSSHTNLPSSSSSLASLSPINNTNAPNVTSKQQQQATSSTGLGKCEFFFFQKLQTA